MTHPAAATPQPDPNRSHTASALAAAHPAIADALDRAAELAAESIAASTRRAYAADWRGFATWAERRGEVSPALPVSVATCAAYLADMEREGKSVATIRRRVRGLAHAHREAGLESPTSDPRIHRLLAGITRTRAAAGD